MIPSAGILAAPPYSGTPPAAPPSAHLRPDGRRRRPAGGRAVHDAGGVSAQGGLVGGECAVTASMPMPLLMVDDLRGPSRRGLVCAHREGLLQSQLTNKDVVPTAKSAH